MNTSSPDPTYLRTKAAYHHIIHLLDTSLPPPIQDTPESREDRIQAAITQIAALCPANAAEAALAAQFVAANAQAFHCLRLTHDPTTPQMLILRCNAQAANMMRQAQGAMRTLLRAQAARQKQDPNSAGWTEYTATQMMTERLTEPPQEAPLRQAEPPPGPEIHDPGRDVPIPQAATPQPNEDPVIAQAEEYAILYTDRATRIRAHHGMPDGANFPPPDPAIIHALATANTPRLHALEQRQGPRAVSV